VRLTVLRLPEALGERSGCCGGGNKLNLLIIGDSAAVGVGVDKQSDALASQLAEKLAVKHSHLIMLYDCYHCEPFYY